MKNTASHLSAKYGLLKQGSTQDKHNTLDVIMGCFRTLDKKAFQ